MDRVTVKELPSGKIEIVNNGMQTHMQFNCSCEDALPFCKGMCCGNRPSFNVELQPDEIKHYSDDQRVQHPHMENRVFMNYRRDDGHCVEHMENGMCGLHGRWNKPKNCQNWHCSPEGKGDGITKRANGWLMFPTQTV